MDDVTQRVFDLARGCIDELEKQKQYIQLLEQYIEELEIGLEVSAVKPVQLEQLLEMDLFIIRFIRIAIKVLII